MPSGSIRLFVDAPLARSDIVPLSRGQAHYLARVMRRAVGDPVILFNGRDGEWAARIVALGRDRADVELASQTRAQAPDSDVWLLFAPLKRDATELVVEKATELGASAIRPVLTARTNFPRLNLDRLRAIATEAAEQCERLTVPDIAVPVPLHEALAAWPAGRKLIAAMEREPAPGIARPAGPAALLVGPEGGLTPAELDVLRRTAFIVPGSLGPRILRAETAAIAGLALLLGRPDD